MTCNQTPHTTCWIDNVRDDYTTTNWYYLTGGAYNSSNPITYVFQLAPGQHTSRNACAALDNGSQFADVGCDGTARPALCMLLTELPIVFGFKTTGGTDSDSYQPMTTTFYWGDLMFQCERIPEFKNTLFTCNSLNSTKQCVNLPTEAQYGMHLSNPSSDTVTIGSLYLAFGNNVIEPYIGANGIGDDGGYYHRYYDLIGPNLDDAPANVNGPKGSSTPICETASPTESPSLAPTNAPSLPPTNAPSLSPTLAPTTCYDDGISLSNDGYEESPAEKILNLKFTRPIDATKVKNVAMDFELYRDALNYQNDYDIELRCGGLFSCGHAMITFMNHSFLNILCNGSYACSGTEITIRSSQNAQIICNGLNSCEGSSINIVSDMDDSISIDCGQAHSCDDMTINVNGHGSSYTSCIGLRACDGLLVNIDADRYKTNFLNMYSWSNDVIFSNGFGLTETVNISNRAETIHYVTCNEQYTFIKWNESLNSTDALEPVILNEFDN
eukprot:934689_1